MGFDNIAIVYIKGSAYRIHFCYMSEDGAINIMNGSILLDKRVVLYIFFVLYIKMSEHNSIQCNSIEYAYLTYYQKNREVILSRAKDYYENNKKILRVQARNKYRNLSEEEKNKKIKYEKNIYRNMSEEENKRLKEYQKNYREAKSLSIIVNQNSFLIAI